MSFRSFSLEQLLSAAALSLLTGFIIARSTAPGKKAGKKNIRKKSTQDKKKSVGAAATGTATVSSKKDTEPKSSKAIDEDSEEYIDSDEDADFTTEDESEGEENEGLKDFDHKEEYKMVLVIRTDLGMGKGKAAAQCCHACLANYRELAAKSPNTLKRWEYYSGQAKVTLKIDSEDDMLKLQQNARAAGLAAHSIRDAGRTQIAAGSRTVLAVGPGPISVVNQVTGHLKLY